MTALGSLFAIIVAKEFFGGLGANVFNPALAGRAFMLMSFPVAMTTWLKPAAAGSLFRPDGTTGATPLGIFHTGGSLLADASSAATSTVTSGTIAESLGGLSTKFEVYKELFLGFRGGCIGETSILLILAGALYLLITKTIDWRAPVAMLVSSVVFSLITGCDPVFNLLSGGLVFGACFMATDYVSAPVTETGKLIFGAGAGLIVVLVRRFGAYPEGVMFSILIMNAVTPFLNKILHKKYGWVKPKKPVKGGSK
jgi:electron transport complex protein RnfD